MYSRSLDPRRVPTALPSHYGGSAFRSDGTPTPIPVKREYEMQAKGRDNREATREEMLDADGPPLSEDPTGDPAEEGTETEASPTVSANGHPPCEEKTPHGGDPFLSRLLGGVLPGVREDDLLLLLLILLLSREEGNEDVLLLLAFLLLAK